MPTTTPFNNLITFSRGSNATVTGPNGLIQWAPNNLLTFSEQFDNAAWTKSDATIFANQDFGNGTLGPELVTNGDFSGGTTTGWSATGSAILSVVSGRLRVENGAAVTGGATQTINTVAGRTYFWTYYVDPATSGGAVIRVRDGGTLAVISTATRTVGGTYVVYFVATGATTQINCINSNSTIGAYQDVDDISIKELTPAAATAPDGTQTADTAAPIGATPIVRQTFTTSAAGLYTGSVWLRSATNTNVTISLRPTGAGSPVSVVCAVTPTWQRFTVSLTAVTGVSNIQFWIEQFSQAVLLWGAQLELGSTATTYNSTTVKNLLGFSEAFDNAAWGTPTGGSIVTGAQANPINGAFNAQKLMENTSTGLHFIAQAATTAAAPYTFSCYVKAAGRNFVFLYNPATNISLSVDLTTGATGQASGTVAPTSSSAVSVGNGWYRVSMTLTTTAASNNFRIYLGQSLTGTGSYTGDGNSGVYIYGAQLSDSASLDPYVPTPGAAPSSTAFYGPRFDFDPVTRAPRGLLVEEQRTNLALRSDDFANATWVKSDVNVTANSAVAPDGDTTADLLIPTAVNTVHTVVQTITTPASSMAFSFYAKPGGYNFIQVHDGTSATDYINFDLSTGVVGNASGYTGAITAVGNGWYRCTAFKTFTAAAHEFRLNPLDANTASRRPSFAGNGTSGVLVWGAQLEAGAFATSYIPTVASTVTRSADVATITGQNFAQWFGQAEGTFVADVLDNAAGVNVLVASDGTTTNQLIMASSTLNIFSVFTGGAFQAQLGVTPPAPYKTAGAYKVNDFAAAANGGTVSTDTSGALATYSRLSIGTNAVGNAAFLNGHIRSINFIPARAADFQLQALTAQTIVDYFFLQTATGDQLVDGNGDELYSLPIFG